MDKILKLIPQKAICVRQNREHWLGNELKSTIYKEHLKINRKKIPPKLDKGLKQGSKK